MQYIYAMLQYLYSPNLSDIIMLCYCYQCKHVSRLLHRWMRPSYPVQLSSSWQIPHRFVGLECDAVAEPDAGVQEGLSGDAYISLLLHHLELGSKGEKLW